MQGCWHCLYAEDVSQAYVNVCNSVNLQLFNERVVRQL